jgi:hypothetical protein
MGTTVSGCEFVGVKWEGKALEAVNDVARGLLNLTEILKGQNVVIESMLTVGGEVGKGGSKPTKKAGTTQGI